MRRIGVVTVGRSDFGLYRPLLRRIRGNRGTTLILFVAGAHLSRDYGYTVREIEAAGYREYVPVRLLGRSDRPAAIAGAMGRGVSRFAAAYVRTRPDIVVVLGDRFEMHSAALAALPLNLPVAHIHGGELTEGAIDDALRHSLTKLSHLHFPSTRAYARRIAQMGEEKWRIEMVGALGLDNLAEIDIPGRRELAARYGDAMAGDFLLVTYHPVTLEFGDAGVQVRQLLAALRSSGLPAVITAPNADTNSRVVRGLLRRHVAADRRSIFVENFGMRDYYGAMTAARAMVGNSSSGLIESASFRLPVVNIGSRQAGRVRAPNVIDCGNSSAAISRAIARALSPGFRRRARCPNPYFAGGASDRILQRLREVSLDARLVRKRFQDLSPR